MPARDRERRGGDQRERERTGREKEACGSSRGRGGTLLAESERARIDDGAATRLGRIDDVDHEKNC